MIQGVRKGFRYDHARIKEQKIIDFLDSLNLKYEIELLHCDEEPDVFVINYKNKYYFSFYVNLSYEDFIHELFTEFYRRGFRHACEHLSDKIRETIDNDEIDVDDLEIK
jgi:hypothetical protein